MAMGTARKRCIFVNHAQIEQIAD
eukprot:SAG11_NODE_29597_length_309_cov_0.771429_1_plen_23_part_10